MVYQIRLLYLESICNSPHILTRLYHSWQLLCRETLGVKKYKSRFKFQTASSVVPMLSLFVHPFVCEFLGFLTSC